MRIFEFAFNPKKSKDRFFEVYSYEAKAASEKPKGSLYVVAELQQALEFQNKFLRRLAETIQKEYYTSSLKTAEPALKAALKKANSFLQQESREGNVDWLGNLNAAVLVFVTVGEKKKVLHLAKTGSVKVYLNRQGSLVDVGKNLEGQDAGNPGKVFGTIVSGNLQPDDTVTALSKDLHDFFVKEKSLQALTLLKEAKQLKQFFQARKRIVNQLSGLVFHVVIEEAQALSRKALGPRLPLPKPKLMLPKRIPASFPSFSFKLDLPFLRHPSAFRRKLTLVGLFALLLVFGFALFQGSKHGQNQEAQQALEEIVQLRREAGNALIFQNKNTANRLLKEAFELASMHEFEELQEELKAELAPLNNMVQLENPELAVEVSQLETTLVPQRMLVLNNTLYLFNPFASQLFAFDLKEREVQTFSSPRNLKLGTVIADSFVFFAEPNILLRGAPGAEWQEQPVSLPSLGFAPTAMASFEESVYLLDSDKGRIVKYPDPFGGKTNPRFWLKQASSERPQGASSFAIDGNIWVAQGSEIHRYFTGLFQESVPFSLFPPLKAAVDIATSRDVPYLYLADQAEERVVVLGKFGELVSQYQAEEFASVSDLGFADNGETLYVLSGNRVFVIRDIGE